MRVPNDHKLVHNLPTGLIDIVLGGHDHIWHYEKLSESFYLKSGTNFKNLSLIRISIGDPLKRDWISEIQKLVEGISNEDLSKETEYSVIEKSHEYLL
jgi:5'-nucleotidase